MTREEIIANLIEFAALAYKVDAATLSENTNLNELGTSSVQRVAMSASIENEYDVMIPVARFGNFETIGKLADFVMEEAE
jgi:acyl carrier protein